MRYFRLLQAAVFAVATGIQVVAAGSFQLTAIVGKDMKSTFECWTLEQEVADVQGMKILQVGDIQKATYLEMPVERDFTQGPYTAPNPQYFVILQGNATIMFPTSDEVLHVQPRRLYAATDNAETSELGHTTVVAAGSLILQLPFKDGVVPAHTAVPGECGASLTAQVRDEL